MSCECVDWTYLTRNKVSRQAVLKTVPVSQEAVTLSGVGLEACMRLPFFVCVLRIVSISTLDTSF